MSEQVVDYNSLMDKKSAAEQNRGLIRVWLSVVLVAIFALVIVGGATRLTDSGLSITEWKPVHGVVPPLSVEEWNQEFELYKQIPEYQQINKGMSLDEFKVIYWWEWGHRFLARAVGVLFGVPLLILWVTGRVEQRLRVPLLGLLVLGGMQGALGWWMVKSGLVDRVDVSQYRLAAHLTLACLIFAAIVWVMRAVTPHNLEPSPVSNAQSLAMILTKLIVLQIFLGGLVAGLDAGLAFNTWPLMDGAIIPQGLTVLEPMWRNFFENPKTVQLVHRMGAYLIWFIALYHMVTVLRANNEATHSRRAVVLFGLITLQAIFGIITLLTQVPMSWGLIHQGMALIVLGFAVAHWRGFIGEYALPIEVKRRT